MPVKNMDGVALYNEKQNEIVRQCLRDALVILMKQKKTTLYRLANYVEKREYQGQDSITIFQL